MSWYVWAATPLAGLIGMMSGGYWGVGCGWFMVPALLVLGVDTMTAIGVALLQMMLATIPTVCRQYREIGWGPGSYGRSLALPVCCGAVATSLLGKVANRHLIAYFDSEKPILLIFVFFVSVICIQSAWVRTACYVTAPPVISRRQSCRAGLYGVTAGLVSSMCGIGGGLFIRPLLTTVFRVPEFFTSRIVRMSVLLTTGAGGVTYLAGAGGWNRDVLLLGGLAAAGGLVGFPIGTKLHRVVYDAGYAQHIHKSFSVLAFLSVVGAVFKLVNWNAAGEWVIVFSAGILLVYLLGFAWYAGSHPIAQREET